MTAKLGSESLWYYQPFNTGPVGTQTPGRHQQTHYLVHSLGHHFLSSFSSYQFWIVSVYQAWLCTIIKDIMASWEIDQLGISWHAFWHPSGVRCTKNGKNNMIFEFWIQHISWLIWWYSKLYPVISSFIYWMTPRCFGVDDYLIRLINSVECPVKLTR